MVPIVEDNADGPPGWSNMQSGVPYNTGMDGDRGSDEAIEGLDALDHEDVVDDMHDSDANVEAVRVFVGNDVLESKIKLELRSSLGNVEEAINHLFGD